MSKITVYGVPLSQPFRSVVWTLLQKRVPFNVKLVVPGSSHKTGGTRGEEFRSLTGGRTTQVPVLRDEENNAGFVVHESPAILTYLCQKHRWTDLYPPANTPKDLRLRTLVDAYSHWHHEGTRCLSRLTQPALRPDLATPASSDGRHLLHADEVREQARAILSRLDTAWLSQEEEASYLVGPTVTIADILCYGEVSQAVMLGAVRSLEEYPNLQGWVDRMRRVDFHDDAHAALAVLGDVFDDRTDGVPLTKRLGAATKAGLKAIDEAQATYRPA